MNGCDIWSAAKKICLQEDNDWFESEEGNFRPEKCKEDDKSKKENQQNELDCESETETAGVEMADIKEELI